MRVTRPNIAVLAACLNLSLGCIAGPEEVGAIADTATDGGSDGQTSAPESDTDLGTDSQGETTLDTDAETSTGEASTLCEDPNEPGCCLDKDWDGIPDGQDNSPSDHNPAQGDQDADGFADAIDLCPLVASDLSNTEDADNDGIGDACDLCPASLAQYNAFAPVGSPPEYMLVRNVPSNSDRDGDGVGDACDNCPTVPNCLDYGIDAPFDLTTDLVPTWGTQGCQEDSDGDGVGDACEGLVQEGAEEPIGLQGTEDFDQDGLPNIIDSCPRLPIPEPTPCTPETSDVDCGESRWCSPQGLCSHVDSDSDGVGDICDTCAYVANPDQAVEGGMQEDDEDGDFVGEACELGGFAGCGARKNPAKIEYHPVEVAGTCCVQSLLVDEDTGNLHRADQCPSTDSEPTECAQLLAPDPADPSRRIPVRLSSMCSEADEAASLCTSLPAVQEATPGTLALPIGCEEALAEAGLTARENRADSGTDRPAYWNHGCRMPQADYDFDGLGNECDMCPLSFDPTNTQYVDASGRLWPTDGAFCNGDYNVCN